VRAEIQEIQGQHFLEEIHQVQAHQLHQVVVVVLGALVELQMPIMLLRELQEERDRAEPLEH